MIIAPALSDGLPTEGEPRCAGNFSLMPSALGRLREKKKYLEG
jgi:hypothetical protein